MRDHTQDYLFNNELVPVTFAWGFLKCPLEIAVDRFSAWQHHILRITKEQKTQGTLRSILEQLEPLDSDGSKTVFCETKSEWTAFFDNSAKGAEAETVVSYLAESLRTMGCVFVTIPNTVTRAGIERGVWGCHAFRLYGPGKDGKTRLIRSVSLQNDADGWEFDMVGEPLAFEEISQYEKKRGKEKLTLEALNHFGRALQLQIFSEAFYGPMAVYVKARSLLQRGSKRLSFFEARYCLGFT